MIFIPGWRFSVSKRSSLLPTLSQGQEETGFESGFRSHGPLLAETETIDWGPMPHTDACTSYIFSRRLPRRGDMHSTIMVGSGVIASAAWQSCFFFRSAPCARK